MYFLEENDTCVNRRLKQPRALVCSVSMGSYVRPIYIAGTDSAATSRQVSAQPAPQPLVGGTEGPPTFDFGSAMPSIAAAPASSFMHEVSRAMSSSFVALLLACVCTKVLHL